MTQRRRPGVIEPSAPPQNRFVHGPSAGTKSRTPAHRRLLADLATLVRDSFTPDRARPAPADGRHAAAAATTTLRWSPWLSKTLLQELFVDDHFESLVASPGRLITRHCLQALAVAVILSHSRHPDDLPRTSGALGSTAPYLWANSDGSSQRQCVSLRPNNPKRPRSERRSRSLLLRRPVIERLGWPGHAWQRPAMDYLVTGTSPYSLR
jgi:hypothetical protein